MSLQLNQYRRRREHFIDYLGGVCAHCGVKENLTFDHIDPRTKSFDISARLTSGYDKVKSEVDKCQLLCRNCHKIKNETDLGKMVHGKYSMYRHGKCRCELCKKANQDQLRAWRARKA